MNKVILIGRLTRDAEIRYTNGTGANDNMAVVRFSLAVDRKTAKDDNGNAAADFISCVAFGKTAEFINKYFHKGSKIVVEGRIQTGSYTDRDGKKVYTTDVIVESVEFGEGKAAGGNNSANNQQTDANGFMSIPEGMADELPFN